MSCQLPSALVIGEMVRYGLTQATLSTSSNKVKLRELNLAFNNLQSFEYNNTGTKGKPTVLNDIEELDLSHNTTLHTFVLLTYLKVLYLSFCKIQHLPDMSGFHQLKQLCLRGNKLGVYFPHLFKCVQV